MMCSFSICTVQTSYVVVRRCSHGFSLLFDIFQRLATSFCCCNNKFISRESKLKSTAFLSKNTHPMANPIPITNEEILNNVFAQGILVDKNISMTAINPGVERLPPTHALQLV